MTYSPFDVARATGNNLASGFRKVNDENAIESILSQAMQGGPEQLQGAIGQILSQVSPERQPAAIKYLEGSLERLDQQEKLSREQEKLGREKEAAKKAGVDPDLPIGLQKEQFKTNAKNKRLDSIYGSGEQSNSQSNQPVSQNGGLRALPDEQLEKLSGHPDKEVSEPAKQVLKSRQELAKEDRADLREKRKETLPLRQVIIEEANLARDSIRNKSHLIEIIDRNNLDDPTFAIFAESLPANLGKRMLSEDTVEYKGGLVDEFGDLKNIFKGATRVKEVEIYENKLADLYLTDSQKKAILKSRINASKVPIIREEAAAEVEEKYPNLSALQFNKKVDEIAKPKIDKLFNSVWDEQKSILDQAERRKEIPLDPKDPEDYSILKQLLMEAGGDKQKARDIAKKKGYKF